VHQRGPNIGRKIDDIIPVYVEDGREDEVNHNLAQICYVPVRQPLHYGFCIISTIL